jgi:uncharacterized protein YjdB
MYYKSFLSRVAGVALALFLAGCGDEEEKVALQSINVTPSSLTLNPGQTGQLTAEAEPKNATEVSFQWSSAGTSIATVSDKGLVTAVAEGTTTVTVRSGSVKKDVEVTVNLLALTSFMVTPSPLTLTLLDQPAQLTVTKTPADAGGAFTYASDDEDVVTVDADGLVTVVGLGDAVITVTSGSLAPVTVNVSVIRPPLTGITGLPEAINVSIVGAKVQLTPEPIPAEAGDLAYRYATSDINVATVSEGEVTITGAGNATITVSCGEITKDVPVTVTIPTPDASFEKSAWTVTASDVWNEGYAAEKLIDGDELNHWHTTPGSGVPVDITVDMKGNKSIEGFYLIHRPEPEQPANPKAITIDVSMDAETWVPVYQTDNLSQEKTAILLELDQPVVARYFKVTITATNSGDTYTYLAEIGAYNDEEPYEPPVVETGPVYPLTFTEGYGVEIVQNNDQDNSVTLKIIGDGNGGDPQAITGAIGRPLGGSTAVFKFDYKTNKAVPYQDPTWGMMFFWCRGGVTTEGATTQYQVDHETEWKEFSLDITSIKDNHGFGNAANHFIRFDPVNAYLDGYEITIRNLRIETDESE